MKRLSRLERVLLLIAALLLGANAFVFMDIRQGQQGLASAQEEVADLQRKVKLMRQDYDIEALKAEVAQLTRKEREENPFPALVPTTSLNNAVIAAAEASGVELLGLSLTLPGMEVLGEGEGEYRVVAGELQLEGNTPALIAMLQGVEASLPRTMVIDRFTLNLQDETWLGQWQIKVYSYGGE